MVHQGYPCLAPPAANVSCTCHVAQPHHDATERHLSHFHFFAEPASSSRPKWTKKPRHTASTRNRQDRSQVRSHGLTVESGSPIIHLLLVTSLATGPGLLTVWIAVICLAPTLFRRCPICFSLASTFDKLPSIPPLRLLGLVLSCIFCRPVTCLALASCITRSFLFHFLVSVVSRAG